MSYTFCEKKVGEKLHELRMGRTYRDAPKVDGLIFVETGELLMSGDFAKVTVTGAEEYDLIGGLTNELTE